MSNPERLTKAYFDKQFARTVLAVKQIGQRSGIASGRVIPNSGDLPIHAGRRLNATVMFLDICKFSDRPAWTEGEQETLLRILSLFFSEMIRIVRDFGGTVEKNTGDGLMAYFANASSGGVTCQQQAVASALTMFSASTHIINPIIEAAGLQPLDFRICLDHGPITVAQVGAARDFNGIVAIGTTANIASKMLSEAKANELIIGTKVLEGLPHLWQQKYARLQTADTGWYYTETGLPYAYWCYNGRWVLP